MDMVSLSSSVFVSSRHVTHSNHGGAASKLIGTAEAVWRIQNGRRRRTEMPLALSPEDQHHRHLHHHGAISRKDVQPRSITATATKATALASTPSQLFSMFSSYNQITVLEIPQDTESDFAGSRILLLDESGNVHSIYKHDSKWTGAYWDQFSILPPIVPAGPIAIFGLGGGTSARLMLDLWPSCKLIGWEIDYVLVDAARLFLGLSDLEVPTEHGGVLQVIIGDALSPSTTIEGGFAGIIIDLFADGQVLPQLRQAKTWHGLKKRLKDGGRIMINCGGTCVERSDPISRYDDGTWTWEDGGFAKDSTLRAIAEAFPGQTLYKILGGAADNHMALTGPLPDLGTWAAALPLKLQKGLTEWKTFP